MRRRAFFATLLSCAALLISVAFSLGISAAPAQAADPIAPYVELTPDSGQLAPGGSALAVDALFHNTLDTAVTDSFIVAVGIRLAPPAALLTSRQVTVEWFDVGASVWRAVELTPGDTALSGFLSTDAGAPSVGSLPAGGTARIGLRISLAATVPTATTVQFVTQGLVEPSPLIDPVALMDGKASYTVTTPPTASNSASSSTSASASASASVSASVSASASATPAHSASGTATPSRSSSASAVPTMSAVPVPVPSALSGGTGGGQLADSGTPAVAAVAGAAALVCATGVALAVTRRTRHGRD
ncbi:hypothetical protein SAMN04487983_1003271 [Streptomyces sp. yr375]|uniref:hypothetical protein n=1 Tax=Streptomyces sp. yr375 TaxID=1761906 RepID=UPI0008C18C13|nr:hypothetical protein [Streptomyces sp. yr375]SEQ18857.1 hypothetical protein SAMN04487983_1003271 [Streptomyces sp. yr375]